MRSEHHAGFVSTPTLEDALVTHQASQDCSNAVVVLDLAEEPHEERNRTALEKAERVATKSRAEAAAAGNKRNDRDK